MISPYLFLMGVATIIAMAIATQITLRYAHRPDGVITTARPYVPSGVTDQWGTPIPAPVTPDRPEEKPLWLLWGQLFVVCELAATLVVAIFTGGFGAWAAIFGQGG